ncbi:response regulator transcription factor [Paenibacillus lemnae]|uniref:Response regulator transcription factor n=1 Tax=Paenibacillus lemnae TaxID=1330551 RepID=A0A848M8Y0_PAELE|nr:response regulator [Paenibacillus lemnae]NMO97678.1 response regulator transcription factor [Paenibacillus lemnae]
MKLLIVDDEVHIREGIRDGIDWNTLGFEEVVVAENGIEALELFHQIKPELVITDIRMPGMDGLELSERIRKASKITQIILLSGYSEFEYARSALTIGIHYYELKPVKLRHLIQLVKSIKNEIKAEQEQQQEVIHYRKLKLWKMLEQEDYQNLNFLGKELFELFGFDPKGIFVLSTFAAEEKHTVLRLEEVMKETGSPMIFAVQMETNGDTKLILQPKFHGNALQETYQFLHEVRNKVRQQCGISLSAGLSSTGKLSQFKQLVEESATALASRIIKGNGIYTYQKKNIDEHRHVLIRKEKELRDSISMLHFTPVQEIIYEEFSRLSEEAGLTLDKVRNMTLDLVNILIRSLQGLHYIDALEMQSFKHFQTMNEYMDWVLKLYQSKLEDLKTVQNVKHSPIIIKAVQYIKKNYKESLTIERLADVLAITPNYFSHLFKKETGVPFNEYLNRLRVEEAKKLLSSTDLMAYEIPERVGFQNYKYFLSVFKKYSGQSPTDYRKQYSCIEL